MPYYSPQSPRNAPPTNRQLSIIVGIFAVSIFSIIWSIALLLNSLVWLIPPSFEAKLGELIVPIYEQQALASPVQNALDRLLDRLENNLPPQSHRGRDYRILYLPQSPVNALAIPGDRIVIYRGLLQQAESENEVMMVLGHELGHFANRDHLRGLTRSLILQSAVAFFLGDTNMLESLIGSAIDNLANVRYSQAREREADEVGLVLLNQTYGHVAGATDFFKRSSQKNRQNIDFFSTHPAPLLRVKRLEEIIEKRHYSIGERTPLEPELKEIAIS